MKRVTIWVLILSIVSALVIGFILYNSLQPSKASNERSERLVASLLHKDPEAVSHEQRVLARKLAHVIEYALLGLCIGGALLYLYKRRKKLYLWAALFISLALGVLDEYIQGFVGRTSRVGDVCLDFVGAVCGMLIVFAVYFIYRKIKNRTV